MGDPATDLDAHAHEVTSLLRDWMLDPLAGDEAAQTVTIFAAM